MLFLPYVLFCSLFASLPPWWTERFLTFYGGVVGRRWGYHCELLLKNWCGSAGVNINECGSSSHAVTFCRCLLSTWLFLPNTWLHYLPPLENIKCPTKNLQKASCILPVIKSDQQSLSHAQCDRPRHGADGIILHYWCHLLSACVQGLII